MKELKESSGHGGEEGVGESSRTREWREGKVDSPARPMSDVWRMIGSCGLEVEYSRRRKERLAETSLE